MKKYAAIFFLLFSIGCASVNISSYIQPQNPYKRVFYGDFDTVVGVVKEALAGSGWQVAKEAHPAIYERNAAYTQDDPGHALILTDVKQASRIIYSKYSHLNVFIHRIAEGVEVDVRFGSVTDIYLKKTNRYRNDKLVNKLLDRIEQKLLAGK